MFHPQTLADAFNLARLQEQQLQLTSTASKSFTKSFSPNFSFTGHYSTTPVSPKPNLTSPKSLPTTPKSFFQPPPKTDPQHLIFKRLSQEDMDKRRAQGLCYNCDTVYTTCHLCKGRQKATCCIWILLHLRTQMKRKKYLKKHKNLQCNLTLRFLCMH